MEKMVGLTCAASFFVQPIQIMGFAMLTILLSVLGFAYWRLKESAVGAFVALYCLSELLFFISPPYNLLPRCCYFSSWGPSLQHVHILTSPPLPIANLFQNLGPVSLYHIQSIVELTTADSDAFIEHNHVHYSWRSVPYSCTCRFSDAHVTRFVDTYFLQYRSTAHGISAASGKLGAIIAQIVRSRTPRLPPLPRSR